MRQGVNPLVVVKQVVVNIISEVIRKSQSNLSIDPNWIISPYSPTPTTIIEAARTLYENHSVEEYYQA
jgi:hypothetical protein